jgi:hypothetical protein
LLAETAAGKRGQGSEKSGCLRKIAAQRVARKVSARQKNMPAFQK